MPGRRRLGRGRLDRSRVGRPAGPSHAYSPMHTVSTTMTDPTSRARVAAGSTGERGVNAAALAITGACEASRGGRGPGRFS